MLQSQLEPEELSAVHPTSTGQSYERNEFNMFTPLDLNTLLASPGDWGNLHARANTSAKRSSSGYFELSIPDNHAPKMAYSINTGLGDMPSVFAHNGKMEQELVDEVHTYDGFVHSGPLDTTTPRPPPQQAPTRAAFTSLNPSRTIDRQSQHNTIEPSQTRLHSLSHSSSSCSGSGSGFSTDAPSTKASPQSSSSPVVAKRRRTSDESACSPARAIYLEKNRKAASKCRGKQKRQQEDLVEMARDVERRNKALKVEVEILKSDMRDLMGIVGQHTACEDGRMRVYVEREAERLVPLAQIEEYTAKGKNE